MTHVKAITINYLYDVVSDRHCYRVTYSLEGEPKRSDEIKFTSEVLSKVDNATQCVADAFAMLWKQNKISKTARGNLYNFLLKALKNTYQNKFQWNTAYGGDHNLTVFPYFNNSDVKTATSTWATINGKQIDAVARKLPGVMAKVDPPCGCCRNPARLYDTIMHLNDTVGWSREQIADWIDKLHDDGIINAEFQPWDETGMAEEEKDLTEPELGHSLVDGDEGSEPIQPSSMLAVLPDGSVSLVPFNVAVGQAAEALKDATAAAVEAAGIMQGFNNMYSIMDEIQDFHEENSGGEQ